MTQAGPGPTTRTHATTAPAGHYRQLDALRGLAALVVVFTHGAAVWELSDYSPGVQRLVGDVLLPLINGRASVILFFVLSGFVLALPWTRGRQPTYPVFARRRLARIYLPYLAALALALVADWQLGGPLQVSRWFSQTWTEPVTARLVLDHVLMIGVYDTAQVNTAFWSLPVEMVLSLVFPLLTLVLLRWRAALSAGAVLAAVAVNAAWPRLAGGRLGTDAYNVSNGLTLGLVSFAFGITLARHQAAVRAAWERTGTAPRVALLVVSFLCFEWLSRAGGINLSQLETVTGVLGATGLIVVALCSRRVAAVLAHRVVVWLGAVSYSLYLVHGTVLYALMHLLYGPWSRTAVIVLYLPLALGVAAIFHAYVEQPCIRLSRSIGRSPQPAAHP